MGHNTRNMHSHTWLPDKWHQLRIQLSQILELISAMNKGYGEANEGSNGGHTVLPVQHTIQPMQSTVGCTQLKA